MSGAGGSGAVSANERLNGVAGAVVVVLLWLCVGLSSGGGGGGGGGDCKAAEAVGDGRPAVLSGGKEEGAGAVSRGGEEPAVAAPVLRGVDGLSSLPLDG